FGALLALHVLVVDADARFERLDVLERVAEALFEPLAQAALVALVGGGAGARVGPELLEEGAGQRITADQPVVHEGEGQALGVALEPEAELGELDGELVLVDTVQTMDGDQAAAEREGLLLAQAVVALGGAAREVADEIVV